MDAKAMPSMSAEGALVPAGAGTIKKLGSSGTSAVGPQDCIVRCCAFAGQVWDLYCGGTLEAQYTCGDSECFQWCCS